MTHCKITVNGVSRIVPKETAMDVSDEMMIGQPVGTFPSYETCDEHGNVEESPDTVREPETNVSSEETKEEKKESSPVYSDWNNTKVDQDAKTRIEELHNKLREAGAKINTSEQFFETGTRMARDGYATQKARKVEHDKKQLARNAIEEFNSVIANESRQDREVSANELAKAITIRDNKDIYAFGHLFSERAIAGLMVRLKSPAASYILGLQGRIHNEEGILRPNKELLQSDADTLAHVIYQECKRYGDTTLKLRTRKNPNDIFAVLSDTYGIADSPQVMKQLALQLTPDSKGSYSYDPDSTTWEFRVSSFTDVEVDKQAVGEPFEAYVSLQSRDNGTSRFRGGGGINILRCLNASTYSADSSEGSRVHKGKNVIYDVNKIIRNASQAIHTLCKAWGRNRTQEIPLEKGVTLEEFIPGIWSNLLREGELSKVLVGKKQEHVKGLTLSYENERREQDKIVVADLANGWTKYIQGQPAPIRREAELAIGGWSIRPPNRFRCDLDR